ncbi:uncharacterized protein DDB_G0283697-like [Chelonus insularis]|uniref:uncharacterized protein DDB_G0283697-like n=1 Tax=Chelonus insularis TaxID=460826 RepID=UPI00158B6FE7|nr:uncharacterized protein DDB_G0283697-like [Chelonus insularis]
MEDDFDIYEDLDFGKKKREDNSQTNKNNDELLDKVKKLEERIKNLETELTKEANQRKILETNFSSLLKTAKNELSRKDRLISDLRAQIDNIYFRRNKVCAQKDNSTENIQSSSETKKDPEPISKGQVEEKYEKDNNSDKSLPLYFSPGPQLISRFESLSDDEGTEVTCKPNLLTSTVFGERLKRRLKDQEEKERFQLEQTKSLTSVSKNNEIVDTKTEVETSNINSIDNKENQYRLISLDISPKKNLKRPSEDEVNEVLDKRKKYFELNEASESCKSKKIDHIEISGSCTDKFINTNTHTSKYFCSINNGDNPLETVNEHRKKSSKSPEYDKRHFSRYVNEQRDDRYCKKYRDDEYRDNRSKSRSRIDLDSEQNYSCIDRGKSRGRGKYHDGRGRNNYYNREDDFSRNRSRNRLDSRNHVKQWKNNEVTYKNDVNALRYSDEKIYGEVRRSRRIEARSHSHYTEYKEDINYRNRDNYKSRQYEIKNRIRRRSKSRGRSREKNSTDSTSSRKNNSGWTDNGKEDQLELNNSFEEGEILDNLITVEEMNIINNIFEGNDETVQDNILNPVFQSPREEIIENIQDFIQKFDVKKVDVKADDKNLKRNTDRPIDSMLKINNNKDIHHNKRDRSKEERTESIQKVTLDQHLVNTDVKNKKVDQKEDKTCQEIVIEKKEQPQYFKLELPSNINLKPIGNNVEFKENKCDSNKAEIIQNNEDKNNSDKQPEATTNSTISKELKIEQKPKIVKIDNLTATRDPEYCKILSKYLKKKPELHNSTSNETSTNNVSKSNEENLQNKDKKNKEVVYSEPVEDTKSKKCEKEEPLKVEPDKCIKINTSLEKSEESSSSSTSSVLKIVCEPEPTADPVDEKVKNNECFVSPIPKNPTKRTASKNKMTVKKASASTGSEAKKVAAPRKKKEKVDENQNSSKSKGVMILTTRRRPMRLSDFSSPVTVVSTIQNVDSNQISQAKLEAIKE